MTRNYRVSFEKVRTRLNFAPRMTVADGIDEIIWALSAHMLDDVSERRNYFGNHALPGLQSWDQREDRAEGGAGSQGARKAPATQTMAGHP